MHVAFRDSILRMLMCVQFLPGGFLLIPAYTLSVPGKRAGALLKKCAGKIPRCYRHCATLRTATRYVLAMQYRTIAEDAVEGLFLLQEVVCDTEGISRVACCVHLHVPDGTLRVSGWCAVLYCKMQQSLKT